MKIWFPYIRTYSGGDLALQRLAAGLRQVGHEVHEQALPQFWQYAPRPLSLLPAPPGTELVISSDWWAFAFKRARLPLLAVAHGFLCDPAPEQQRGIARKFFHEVIIRRCYQLTARVADRLVTVSNYTAGVMGRELGRRDIVVIHNGVDTGFFSPDESRPPMKGNPQRVLFVGNLIRRKGAADLPAIMSRLGPEFQLRYTRGWRTNVELPREEHMVDLGLLDAEGARQEYRQADVLLFPSRLEASGLPVLEAMACGVPVVASNSSSLPEHVLDGETGMLCSPGDVDGFADAIRTITSRPAMKQAMGQQARLRAVERFDQRLSLDRYLELIESMRPTFERAA